MLRFIKVGLVGYLALVLTLFLMQRSLLYLPGRYNDIDETVLEGRGVKPWPDYAGYRGYLTIDKLPAPVGSSATVIVFHGNAGSAIDRLYYHHALAFTGARILLVEYPGYGRRPGRPTEAALVSEARSIITEVAGNWPTDKLYVLGESLGAGVAAGAVGDTKTAQLVDGLLLITPWDSLAAVAKKHYWYLPVRWLLRDRYESAHHLAGFSRPKLVVIAKQDSIVPAARGKALFDAIPDPKQLVVIDKAGHNTWINHVDESWWKAIWHHLSV